jgi:hypothetical protein
MTPAQNRRSAVFYTYCVYACVPAQTGASCLHIACEEGRWEMAKYLSQYGGKALLMSTKNVSAVHVRMCGNRSYMCIYLYIYIYIVPQPW